MNAGNKRISFITEGLPWKITVNNWSIQKKTTGTTFPLYKKERERRSRAFPSDSNPGPMMLIGLYSVHFSLIFCFDSVW